MVSKKNTRNGISVPGERPTLRSAVISQNQKII
jgi:hypothetical protein